MVFYVKNPPLLVAIVAALASLKRCW